MLHCIPAQVIVTNIFIDANMGTGLTIFSTGFSRFSDLTLLWVFIAYVVLLIVIDITAYIYTKMSKRFGDTSGALINAEKDEGVSLLVQNKEKKKKPAADSKWRWFLFGIYTTVNVVFTIALIVLVVIPQ